MSCCDGGRAILAAMSRGMEKWLAWHFIENDGVLSRITWSVAFVYISTQISHTCMIK
jgi:hypothetical protein